MNRKTALRHKKKKSRKLSVLLWLITFAFVGVLIMFLFTLTGADSIGEILGNSTYWYAFGFAAGLLVAAYLMMYRIDAQNIALDENDLEDTEWLTPRRLRKLKEFTVTNWSGLENRKDGIVIGAEKKGGGVEIVMTDQLHALIVGTTGSGKTTGFVDQNIAALARSKTKPSLVITDPKSELYEKHAKQLESEGYKISVLNLREPYSSARWNPMNMLIRRIRLVRDLQNNLQNRDGKYYGAGEVFLSYRDARTRVQELKDEIYENAMDLVYTLCPVQNREQPTWEQGARNLVLGLVLAFCEDCIKGKMDEKQLLLFNVYHNITRYCSEDTTALKEYLLEGRDEFSKVRGLVNTVLITSDKTLTSYLSEVNGYMQQLADDGILSLTSENDLDIVNLDEAPNAVFVIVPDERFTRHRFVTLFLKGGEGGKELAAEVIRACEIPSKLEFAYDLQSPVAKKIEDVAKKIYGADGADFSEEALEKIKTIEAKGEGGLPVIIAKTQYSLSDNPDLIGRPSGFRIFVRDIVLKGGAGFIVAIAGKIMLMPGLGAHPAAEKIDLTEDGKIVGLS